MALSLLVVGYVVASPLNDPHPEHHINIHHEGNVHDLNLESRSAPGVIQPDYHFINFDEPQAFFSASHDEYGPPHEEYGPPKEERLVPSTTEQ